MGCKYVPCIRYEENFAKKNTFTLDYEGELEVFKDGSYIRAYGNEITLEAGAAVLLR